MDKMEIRTKKDEITNRKSTSKVPVFQSVADYKKYSDSSDQEIRGTLGRVHRGRYASTLACVSTTAIRKSI